MGHRRELLSMLLGGTALLLSPASHASGQSAWVGAASSDWFTASNWSNGVPDATTPTTIDTNSPNAAVIDTNLAQTTTLDVGVNATGEITIQNGGQLHSQGQNRIGVNLGSTGMVTVDGAGAQWVDSTNGEIDVGWDGTGYIFITNGGVVQSGSSAGIVGARSGSTGTVVVDGAGSDWDAGLSLTVGNFGTGDLTISNGATVESNIGGGFIGWGAGGVGTVTVTDAGSKWTDAGDLNVGSNGTATLWITNGGQVLDNYGNVAASAGSSGTVHVDGTGSTWTSTHDLIVGNSGIGTLTVSGGGMVEDGTGYLGWHDSGTGTATVTGVGSVWNNIGDLYVGYAGGTGTLNVENGGKVENAYGSIGGDADSDGAVHVDGSGSQWVNNQDLYVGDLGNGVLTITDGGFVRNDSGLIGLSAGSTGSVSVSGVGSKWSNDGLAVGFDGAGTLSILDGGLVEDTDGNIGYDAGSSGLVTVAGAGSTWTNSGDLRIGADGDGTLTIHDDGVVSVGGFFHIAESAGSIGVLNIGAAPTYPAGAPGTVTTTSIVFGDGNGTINFNHTGMNYVFSVPISGAGGINQLAGDTDLTGNSPTYTGEVIITGGTLKVDGNLTSSVVDVDGGRLGGTGALYYVNVNNGGTIAPGSSIGTLTADTITFDNGSFYEVEVDDAGNSDLIDASNVAILNGGTVKVQAASGNYAAATQYTILTAANGLSGNKQFDGVTSNLAFLTPTLTYDTDNVYLTLSQNGLAFSSVGDTPNQIATGGGVGSLGAGNPIYDAVLSLSADQARNAFDQLSGEIYPSEATAMLEDSGDLRQAAIDRLRAALSSEIGHDPVLWGRAFGSVGHWDSDGNAADLDHSIGGFLAGADAPVLGNWRLGVLGGYGRSGFGVTDRNSSGLSNDYDLGLYGGGGWGGFAFRTGAAYTLHDVTTRRSVSFPGFSDSLASQYWAGTAELFGELGYDVQAGSATIEPFANLAYINQHAAGFTETGGDAALASTPFDVNATFATLGVHGATDLDLNGVAVTARGTLGWRHDFGDTTPKSIMRFATGGDNFTIAGVPVAHDVALLDASLDLTLSPSATLGISYDGQFGSGGTAQSVHADLSVKF